MIVCIDVDYRDNLAHVGAIIFREWNDDIPFKSYELVVTDIHEYIPGQFYKRELPCIIAILDIITEPIDIIVVDGYVWLTQEKMGLGAYLYQHLQESIPVIGVAKNKYKDVENAIEVLRGESTKPLFITAKGIETNTAAQFIKSMAGEYRFPTLLKSVDHLARNW